LLFVVNYALRGCFLVPTTHCAVAMFNKKKHQALSRLSTADRRSYLTGLTGLPLDKPFSGR
jgi:hypothetical protein